MILEARIMNKNAEQTSTRGFIPVRFHPIYLLSRYSFDLQKRNRGSAFLMMRYGKGAGNTDKGKKFFKTHLPYKDPLQHNHRTKRKKKEIENMVMLFTQLSLICLDLNYKHTSIFQLHTSPTYSVPLDRYSLLLLETLSRSLVPTVL